MLQTVYVTHSAKTEKVAIMCNAFDFIDGGKEGAMERFGQAVRESSRKLGPGAVRQLANAFNMSVNKLIGTPSSLPSLFRPDIIQGCGNMLQLDLRNCFRRSPKLTLEQEQTLHDCVAKWGPAFAAGCTQAAPTKDDFTDLFLLTQALQQLDAAEEIPVGAN